MHWQEAAGRLIDVHDAVCADSVLVHRPAQLDGQPVRVGVLLLRAVALFQALGGRLVPQIACHAKVASPSKTWDGRRVALRRVSRAPSL